MYLKKLQNVHVWFLTGHGGSVWSMVSLIKQAYRETRFVQLMRRGLQKLPICSLQGILMSP